MAYNNRNYIAGFHVAPDGTVWTLGQKGGNPEEPAIRIRSFDGESWTSRFGNDWAADIYGRARARGKRHPHAVRILARAWVYVIWRCWQDRVPYDPERHQALQRLTLAKAA